jgi:hypothetical protein
VFKLPVLYRIISILGLWLLLGATAFASGGAECKGHGFKANMHHASAYVSLQSDALAVQDASPQVAQPQPDFLPISLSEQAPFISQADDACGSCVLCAACCLSVAPPLTLTLTVLLPSAGAVIPPSVPHHRSPDLAALERPPHAAKNLKTA